MTFQQGLQLAIEIFENKIINLENDYKQKHIEDFDRQKMNKHINKKLKKEINGLIFLNLAYPVKILKNRKI
ncbi:MAG TPA: hypothetical protein VJ438_06645 [Candidatus Nanoarchaeia archaeon]|nr:hypothetical protein [Candidatus Nanoarchaeia archaeon]